MASCLHAYLFPFSGISPAVIAAIASRESRAGKLLYNTKGYGDHDNAFGIMQVKCLQDKSFIYSHMLNNLLVFVYATSIVFICFNCFLPEPMFSSL